jgi:hypothetical protein
MTSKEDCARVAAESDCRNALLAPYRPYKVRTAQSQGPTPPALEGF